MVTFDASNQGEEANPYEINALGVLQLYAPFVDGTADCTLAIVSSRALSSHARAALEASAERLGHRVDSCAWVNLSGEGKDDGTQATAEGSNAGASEAVAASQGEPSASALGANDVLTLLEGLDPSAIIATDAAAVSLVSGAYATPMKMDAANRAACRTVVALSDFEGALKDDDAKQRAWSALKKIARSIPRPKKTQIP